jgi:hypothetical protein
LRRAFSSVGEIGWIERAAGFPDPYDSAMTRVARLTLVLAALAFALSGGNASAAATSRADEPVVLAGADLPTLAGTAPDRVVAFSWRGAWKQVPVQVDERALVDLRSLYHGASGGGSTSLSALSYTDPGTFAGPDPDPDLDGNDEVALMSGDGGSKAASPEDPAGVLVGSGVEVRLDDPLPGGSAGYLYLFRGNGSLDPSAGKHYVSYDFHLNSGDYKTSYSFNSGPNPENSTVTTPYYSQHFSDRWVDDELQIHAGAATGADILDRHKSLFAPGNCVRSEDTFSAGEGAFLINKDGPVRAIRAYIGANSGPYTERQHIFYRRSEEIRTFLRVHTIGSILDFFDYSAAAVGMTYRNDHNTAGVTIDGVPDTPVSGTPQWEQASGSQGSLSILSTLDADFATTVTSYYLDDSSPAVTQCTGDGAAYGSSGSNITSTLPNTDPRLGPAGSLTSTRDLYFDPPGAGAAEAQRHLQEAASPLTNQALRRLRASANAHRGSRRSGASVNGNACPAGEATKARLERRARNGRFVLVRKIPLTRKGGCWTYSATALRRSGRYRVVVPGDSSQAGAASPAVAVRPRS